MKRTLLSLCAVTTMAILAGCQNRVVFSTHSSIGLDVSGTAQVPNKVSFSYNRQEAAIVPRKTNGEAHTVFGGLDSDIGFFDGSIIKQTFATGEAAKLATAGAGSGPNRGTDKPDTAALVFLTATTFGLHLTAGESQMTPNMLLGYRRMEAAVIPVPDAAQEVRSVYADILINTKRAGDKPTNGTAITDDYPSNGGVRIKQSFATGEAAENLARYSDSMRAKLLEAADIDIASAILKRNKSKADGISIEIRGELDRLSDAQLNEAIDAFKAAKIFGEVKAAAYKGEANPRKKSQALQKEISNLTTPNELPLETVVKVEQVLALLRKI